MTATVWMPIPRESIEFSSYSILVTKSSTVHLFNQPERIPNIIPLRQPYSWADLARVSAPARDAA